LHSMSLKLRREINWGRWKCYHRQRPYRVSVDSRRGVLPPLPKKNVFSQETGDLTYRRSLYSKLQACDNTNAADWKCFLLFTYPKSAEY